MMIQAAKSILLVVSALFPIVDPIGGSPVFLALTKDYTAQTRRLLAGRIAVNSFILLVASFTIGSHVLSFLTVGPGSISVAITLGANEPHHLGANLLAILAAVVGSVFVAATVYLCYGFRRPAGAIIGPAGMNVILRLSSFLLVCIGVQILWNGASQLLGMLPWAAGPGMLR